jgi:hypothetical protein
MYGLNAGYDTRPMATGAADSGVSLFGTEKTVFFQQAAINLEAVSNTWNFNAYGLLPTGDKEQQINWLYSAGSLATYGLDAGYNITPDLTTSIGYYYQDGDGSEADGSGILGRVAYEITYGLIAGVNVSYDEAFETRVSADVEYRFGGASKTADKKKVAELPLIKALSSSPNHRDVRVHDKLLPQISTETLPDLIFCMSAAKSAENMAQIGKEDGGTYQREYERDLGQFDSVQKSKTSNTFEAITREPSNSYYGKAIIKCSYDSKSNKTTYALYKDNGGSIPKKLDDNDLILSVHLNSYNREVLKNDQGVSRLEMTGDGISLGR